MSTKNGTSAKDGPERECITLSAAGRPSATRGSMSAKLPNHSRKGERG